MIAKINEFAPIINAITVFASFGFVIWTTCFRKTRQDRLDELKFEMRVLFSEGWDERKIRSPKAVEEFYKELHPKFQKERYKRLHQCAFDELGYEGRNPAFRLLKHVQERYEGGNIVTPEDGYVQR